MFMARKQQAGENIQKLSIARLAQHGNAEQYNEQIKTWERQL